MNRTTLFFILGLLAGLLLGAAGGYVLVTEWVNVQARQFGIMKNLEEISPPPLPGSSTFPETGFHSGITFADSALLLNDSLDCANCHY